MTGNAYTLQEIYIYHAFNPLVIIPEGELVYTEKFFTSTRKTSYWYHDPDLVIPIIVKLQQVVMPFIEFIQYTNTTNTFPTRFKEYTYINPRLNI